MPDPENSDHARYFNALVPVRFTASNLPHWSQDDVIYFVTFRLVDSLPAAKLAIWRRERDAWWARVSSGKRCETPSVRLKSEQNAEYHRLFTARIEDWLDQGTGSGLLRIPECRKIVEDALGHFDGERYFLGKFVVAPNHVHALVRPKAGYQLPVILHSWKSFTSKELLKVEAASRRLQENGLRPAVSAGPCKRQDAASTPRARSIWQKESYDHIVRNEDALRKIEAYISSHGS